jgi:bifunctional DNA-binding transcriptional regulator/antitoxin component of YhaV-PrlF toxin-antitoxin module
LDKGGFAQEMRANNLGLNQELLGEIISFMSATVSIDVKGRMTLPESICEAAGFQPNDEVEWRVEEGELRGRKVVAETGETFPPGSLLKYLTPERDKEQLAILSGCVQGPLEAE